MQLTSFFAASIALGLIIAVAVLFRSHRRSRLKRVEWWVAVANRHRLKIENPGEPHEIEVEGTYRGVEVRAFLAGGHIGKGLNLYTHCVAEVPGGAPPGLLIATHSPIRRLDRGRSGPPVALIPPDIASVYAVHGFDADKTVELTTDPELGELLMKAASVADFVRVDGRTVRLEKRGMLGQAMPGFMDLTCRLAAGLAEAHERPWATFAKEHGLLLRGMGTNSTQRVLRGHIRGQRVSIEMGVLPGDRQTTFTTIKVALNLRLPAGFRLAPHAPNPPRGTFRIGVKALDDQIQVQGTNRDQIVSMLTQPVLRDHLAAFYEVCPYTIIENNSVTAGGPGLLTGDMGAQVSAVMDLAVAIRKAWSNVQVRAGDPSGGRREPRSAARG